CSTAAVCREPPAALHSPAAGFEFPVLPFPPFPASSFPFPVSRFPFPVEKKRASPFDDALEFRTAWCVRTGSVVDLFRSLVHRDPQRPQEPAIVRRDLEVLRRGSHARLHGGQRAAVLVLARRKADDGLERHAHVVAGRSGSFTNRLDVRARGGRVRYRLCQLTGEPVDLVHPGALPSPPPGRDPGRRPSPLHRAGAGIGSFSSRCQAGIQERMSHLTTQPYRCQCNDGTFHGVLRKPQRKLSLLTLAVTPRTSHAPTMCRSHGPI